MRRGAFNIIELIFVILILGILSSVVIVKIGNMTQHAKEVQLKSLAEILNRSVGPAIWLNSIEDNRGGSVAFADYDANLSKYVKLVLHYTYGPALISCNIDGNGIFLNYLFGKTYEVHCRDGNATTSPLFRLYNQTDGIYMD